MKNNKAFTLIEILAAIVILGIVLMIAIPSVTGIINRSKQRQLKNDSKMFKALVQAKIASDLSIELPDNRSAYFTLRSIDADSLSGSYDDRSYVEVKNCHFDETTDKYVCDSYKSVLYTADGKTKAVDGVISSEKVNLISYLCENSETYWCYNFPNISPETDVWEEPEPEPSNTIFVTFRLEDGTDYAVREINKGDRVADKPANPSKEGYDFKGWLKNGVIFDVGNVVLYEDTVLVASWEENVIAVDSCNQYDLIKFKNLDDGYEEFYVMKSIPSTDSLVLLSKNGLVGADGNVRQAESEGFGNNITGTQVLISPDSQTYINNYKTYLTRMGLDVLSIGSITADQLSYYCSGAKNNTSGTTVTCTDTGYQILNISDFYFWTSITASSSGYVVRLSVSINSCYESIVKASNNPTHSVRPVVTLKRSRIRGCS